MFGTVGKKWNLRMGAILALFFVALFTVYTLFLMPVVIGSRGFLHTYYLSIWQGPQWILWGLLALTLFFAGIPLISFLRNKAHRTPRQIALHFTRDLLRVLLVGVVGIHLSLGLSFFSVGIVYAQITKTLQSDPGKLGVVSGKDGVAENLKKRDKAPQITISTDDVVAPFLRASLGKQYRLGQFSGEMVKVLPVKLVGKATIPESNLVLLGDTLVIREIKADEMQAIGPEVGRLLVNTYFYPRNIKSSPQLTVLSRQEYLRFRDDQINAQIAEIDESIASINGQISAARSTMTRIIVRYYYGEISIDDAVSQYEAQQGRISKLQGQQAQLRKQKEIVKSQKDSTPYELGIFMPSEPDLIRVVLDTTKEDALNPFLVTMVHEHLHYASYVDKERVLPTFFEEGLTEYFARKIVGEQFGIQAEVGYPVIVRVIQGFTKKVPEQKLADAYFNKDINMLKDSLNEAYGEKFYEESEFHFTMIPFAGRDDAIKLANDLMSVIGEPDIKESDIASE